MWVRIRQMLPESVRKIGGPINRRILLLRYSWYLRKFDVDRKRLLIIGTIYKSGTHYLLFLLANYLRLLSGTANGHVTPPEMFEMFPNDQPYLTFNSPPSYKQPTPHLKLLGLDDLTYMHAAYFSLYWGGSRVVHLYRNPLDFAVSIFFHFYQGYGREISGPVEVLDRELDSYIERYLSYREVAKAGNTNLLRISYEDLVTYPEACLGMVLRWLGTEPDPSIIKMATQHSRVETVRQFEEAGMPIDARTQFTGRFARNGSIGQWKQYFGSADVERTRQRLSTHGIKLEEFTLEA